MVLTAPSALESCSLGNAARGSTETGLSGAVIMHIGSTFTARITLALALPILLTVLPGRAQRTPPDELQALLGRALASSPVIEAQRRRVEQALARHEELLGFYDPSLYAAAGKAERARGVPGSSGFRSLSNQAQEAQIGVEVPVQPGAYVSAGAAERFLFDDGDYSHLYQTLLGVRVRIPLTRDRGFVQWQLSRARTLAEYNGSVSELIMTMQNLRHDIERAYVHAYETLSAYQVAQEATARFQTLLDDARSLADLKVVPSYQVYPAEMELAFRQEDEERTKQAYEISLITLQRTIGDNQEVTLQFGPESLIQQALALRHLPDASLPDALARNGEFLRAQNRLDAARADLALAEDDLKAHVSLNAGITWQGEEPNQPWGIRSIRSEKGLGGEVTLVYERPLMYRAERSRITRYRARIAEHKDIVETISIDVKADLQSATRSFERLQSRLQILDRALEAARKTVEAESERFRLGEGRSRNVLDAQRDLNTAQQRQTRAAAALLRSYYDFRYAAGYPQPE